MLVCLFVCLAVRKERYAAKMSNAKKKSASILNRSTSCFHMIIFPFSECLSPPPSLDQDLDRHLRRTMYQELCKVLETQDSSLIGHNITVQKKNNVEIRET